MTDSTDDDETNEDERKDEQTQYGGTDNPEGAENLRDEDDEE